MSTIQLRTRMQIGVRHTKPSDKVEIVDIERRSTNDPWSAADYIRASNQRSAVGYSAIRGERVVGFCLVNLTRDVVEIQRLTVDSEFFRHGVGTALVKKIQSKLHHDRRRVASIEIRETNVAFQLFLRKMGFKAVKVIRNAFNDLGLEEDAYRFEYCLENEDPDQTKHE
jgi:ribosomal protein S18 acetylase RimI-like enzyme